MADTFFESAITTGKKLSYNETPKGSQTGPEAGVRHATTGVGLRRRDVRLRGSRGGGVARRRAGRRQGRQL